MSQVAAPGTDQARELLARLLASPAAGAAGGWLARLRAAALERAHALSLPTPRDEDWRFTDLAPLTRVAFQPLGAPVPVERDAIARWLVPDTSARLVFVDGVYASGLSSIAAIPAGAAVRTLAGAVAQGVAEVERHLGSVAAIDHNVFAALNTACLRDGVVVLLEDRTRLDAPIHVLHVATATGAPYAMHPRVLLVAGRSSQVTLIEDFVSLGDGPYLSCPVTELLLDDDAEVAHVRVQREGTQAFQLATCAVRQARGSRYRSSALAFGARISRLQHDVVHAGEAATTRIDGLALIGGRQVADTHSFVDHAQPHGRLEQLHKCVVDGAAHAVFSGKILVREGAQRVDARQASRSLLISDKARVDTKPQLEIFADDVKCAHGAAVGQLDADELFYLLSRGLARDAAERLLTWGFAGEIIERIPVRALASALARHLSERAS